MARPLHRLSALRFAIAVVAGCLSALAVMAPGTNPDAATPVVLLGGTPLTQDAVPDAVPTKITNDAAAYGQGLATLHGSDADRAGRAVRETVSLPFDATLKDHIIDLVATDLPDMLAAADGRTVLVAGHPERLDTGNAVPRGVVPDWRDRLLATLTDPSIVYLLLLAGLAGLAFEATHPGVFVPGVLGAICLLLGGYGLNLLPIDYAGVALALFGLGAMVAEAFVPAFGAFVLGGGAAFLVGSLMMFANPAVRPPPAVFAGATLASVALFGLVLVALLRARRRPVVSGDAALIGATGHITQWAGSEGQVQVQGAFWNARANGKLAADQAIRVTGRDGLTLLVEPK